MIFMPITQTPPSIRDRILAFERAMTSKEVSELFSLHQDSIRRQARRGDIPSFRVGTAIRFDPKKLAEWHERQ